MQKLSEIISKPVFSLFEGLWLGTIINVNINISSKKIKGFFMLSSDEEKEYFIKSSDIESAKEDALIIKNVSKLAFVESESVNVLNKRALSICGEDCGIIRELYFDEQYNVLSLETNKGVLLPFEKVVNLGDDVVFFGYDDCKFKKSALRPKNAFSLNKIPDLKVSILNDMASKSVTGAELKTIGELSSADKDLTLTIPKKIKQNPYFLLGRTASSSIKSDSGETIIKEGQKITEKSISKAQLHNLIYELSSCAN